MPKARSPEYPAIGLGDAIEKVRMVFDSDHLNKISKEVMASHMGYKSLNGNSLTILSALSKFGLISGRGNETGVTDLALAILSRERGAKERVEAIRTAAVAPELFADLDGRFPGKASDAGIRSYLLMHKFLPSAADAALRSYRETKQLVEVESSGYNEPEREDRSPMQAEAAHPAPADDVRPYRVGDNIFEPKPPKGTRREVITLDEGDVVITFPEELSPESVADLNDHLQLFVRKAKRRTDPQHRQTISAALRANLKATGGNPETVTDETIDQVLDNMN